MSQTLTLNDLAREILEGWSCRMPECAPRLRGYYVERLRLMCAEFGVQWHDVHDRVFDEKRLAEDRRRYGATGLPSVMMYMPSMYLHLNTPYGNYVVYTFQDSERDVYDRHNDRLASLTQNLKDAWAMFFADLLAARFPEALARTTSEDRLRALGLGPREDPLDYL